MERRKNATTSGSEVEKKNQPTQPATTTRQSAGTPQWTGKGQPENRKWLVTTTTNPRPNQQIMELANISGWTLVVVGNQTSKSPEVWRSDHS